MSLSRSQRPVSRRRLGAHPGGAWSRGWGHGARWAALAALVPGLLGCGDVLLGQLAERGSTGNDTEPDPPPPPDPDIPFDPPDTGAPPADCDPSDADCRCEAVDLLFVIDNSGSMGPYQNALALAFPQFAETLVDALPAGTSLHVGVTSTEMGNSQSGETDRCRGIGDGLMPQEAFYVTPDQTHTGRVGAQGRLYDPGGQEHPYFELTTGGGPGDLDALAAWFGLAARIGENGSQIEMSSAAAGWAVDPVNEPSNGAFVRDVGAVLVVFFLQDEPDQTPLEIGSLDGGQAMLDKLYRAKAACGGQRCVVGGGFVHQACLTEGALWSVLDGFGAPAVVDQLPDPDLAEDDPAAAAAQMNVQLRDTLAGVIARQCDAIPPPPG